MTNKEAAELLQSIADRRLMVHVNYGDTKPAKPDDVNEALRLAIDALLVPVDNSNRCVCCGAVIPEGIQVCPTCERKANK